MVSEKWIMSHVVLIATLSASALYASPKTTNPREHLRTAIPEAIRLLEDRDYEQLVDRFVHPDDADRIVTRRDLARVLRPLGPGNKAEHMITILRSIKDTHPKYSKDGNLATFEIPWHGLARGSSIREMQFRKSGKNWYMTF